MKTNSSKVVIMFVILFLAVTALTAAPATSPLRVSLSLPSPYGKQLGAKGSRADDTRARPAWAHGHYCVGARGLDGAQPPGQ